MLPNGLVEPSDKAREKLKNIKNDEVFLIDFKPKRNVLFHRKMFAMLKVVFLNQDKYSNMEHLRTELKLKSGWYNEHISQKQGIIYIPKSMDFSSMDAIQFEDIYQKFIDIALRDFVSVTNEELQVEIVRFS